MFATLGAFLPVAAAGAQVTGALNLDVQKELAEQLELAEKSIELLGKDSEMLTSWSEEQQKGLPQANPDDLNNSAAWFTQQAIALRTDTPSQTEQGPLRILQQYLQEKHPDFGSLAKVRDAQRRRRWVHQKYASLYQ